jgi:hypothetical protein
MHRREFVQAMAGLGVTAAAQALQERKPKFFTLDAWQIKSGTQQTRMADWLGNSLIPALAKQNAGPIVALEAVFAPSVPEIKLFVGYDSFAQIEAVQNKIGADPALKASWGKIEASESPFESRMSSILETTSYSPAVAEPKVEKPRYYEVRIYHASTEWQLRAINDRFTSATMRLFHAHGIEPLFLTTTRFGSNMPNVTYLIPWDSLAAREKAWDAFNVIPIGSRLARTRSTKAARS